MIAAIDKLDRLIAREDIRDLKSRYFRCVDTHDWEGLATLFCANAIFDTTRARSPDIVQLESEHRSRGRDAILRYIVEGMAGSTSVHHGHGHEITIDSATEAHGIIAMEDRVSWAGPPKLEMHGFGHYHEVYRIEGGAWRIWRSMLTRIRVLDSF